MRDPFETKKSMEKDKFIKYSFYCKKMSEDVSYCTDLKKKSFVLAFFVVTNSLTPKTIM